VQPILQTEHLDILTVWNGTAGQPRSLATFASVLNPAGIVLGTVSAPDGGQASITGIGQTAVVHYLGTPSTVAEGLQLLRSVAPAKTEAAGPNLLAGVRAEVGVNAPPGTTVTPGAGGTQIRFGQSVPHASANPPYSAGVFFQLPKAAAASAYAVSASLSGSGCVVADLWNGQQSNSSSYNLQQGGGPPSVLNISVSTTDSTPVLAVAFLPCAPGTVLSVRALSVERMQRPALTAPVFANLWVNGFSFTPAMVAQMASNLGPDFRLVALPQLVEMHATWSGQRVPGSSTPTAGA
jgi:hypothetical protein